MFSLKRLIRSFRFAARGFYCAFRYEQSFKIGVIFSLIILVLILYFRPRVYETIVLLLLIIAGLILELINATFERVIDIIKPRIHYHAEEAKDMIAATVLLAFVGGVAIVFLIFWPYIRS